MVTIAASQSFVKDNEPFFFFWLTLYPHTSVLCLSHIIVDANQYLRNVWVNWNNKCEGALQTTEHCFSKKIFVAKYVYFVLLEQPALSVFSPLKLTLLP